MVSAITVCRAQIFSLLFGCSLVPVSRETLPEHLVSEHSDLQSGLPVTSLLHSVIIRNRSHELPVQLQDNRGAPHLGSASIVLRGDLAAGLMLLGGALIEGLILTCAESLLAHERLVLRRCPPGAVAIRWASPCRPVLAGARSASLSCK